MNDVDDITDEEVIATVARLGRDFPYFAEHCLKIRTKSGAIEPLVLNDAQRLIHASLEEQREKTGRVRALILKARQQGASTLIGARYYWRAAFGVGQRVAVMTHEQDSTDALFEMVRRYHELMPDGLRHDTEAASAKELKFAGIDSGYIVATAGNKAAGRGRTLQLFHGSEVASWPNAEEHMAGLGQTVPDLPGTEIILESTAKGLGNLWHQMCMRAIAGRGDYQLIFVPWFLESGYRRAVPPDFTLTSEEAEYQALHRLDLEQMAFRRAKIDGDFVGDTGRWAEEYPATPEEAFQAAKRDTFLGAADVIAARRHVFGEPPAGPLVVGVDPARFGDDRTALCWRKGRAVIRMQARQGLDTMQVAGMVAMIIKADKPRRVFVDVIGIGAGVVDRLWELGYREQVVAVNVAERADDPDRWRNKRAEVWGRLRDWLRDKPVSIPDHDALAQDLMQPGYTYSSSGQTTLESKDDIRKRGAPSPDLGDALALTFAELISEQEQPEARGVGNILPDSIGY